MMNAYAENARCDAALRLFEDTKKDSKSDSVSVSLIVSALRASSESNAFAFGERWMLSQTPMQCALIALNAKQTRWTECVDIRNDAVRDGDGYGGARLWYAMLFASAQCTEATFVAQRIRSALFWWARFVAVRFCC